MASLLVVLVLASILFTELIVVPLSFLFRGRLDVDYLITGAITAFFVSLVVLSLVIYLLKLLRHSDELLKVKTVELKQLNDELTSRAYMLQLSENNYKVIFNTIPDIIYEIDVNGNFIFINTSIKRLGYEPEKLIGRHFSEIMTPEEVDKVSRDKVLKSYYGKNIGKEKSPKLFDERRTGDRITVGLEVTLQVRKDEQTNVGNSDMNLCAGRSVIVAEVNSSGVYHFSHNSCNSEFAGTFGIIKPKQLTYKGSVGVIRDITDRKQVEEMLEYNYYVQTIISSILKKSFIPVSLNEQLEKILEMVLSYEGLAGGIIYLVDDYSGDSLVMVAHRGIHGNIVEKCKTVPIGKCICGACAFLKKPVCSSNDSFYEEDIFCLKYNTNGNYCVPLLSEKHTIGLMNFFIKERHDKEERDVLFLSTIATTLSNIIERKRGEDTLSLSNSLLKATLDSTTDGILVVNNTGKIDRFNQQFVDMWDVPEYILQQRNERRVFDYILPKIKDSQYFISKVLELYNNPEAESFDTFERVDGRSLERYSKPQRMGYQIIGRVWSFRDVTQRKLMEFEIIRGKELNEKMAELATELLQSISIEEISDIVLDCARHLTGSVCGFICYVTTDDNVVLLANSRCVCRRNDETTPLLGQEELYAIWNCMLNKKTPLVINSPKEMPKCLQSFFETKPCQRIIVVPSSIDRKMIGLISLMDVGGKYTDNDVETIERISALYAMAIQRKRIEDELQELNATLEKRVLMEIENRRQKEQMMIQQAKLAAMGEMIGSIAHQWRQPLNFLSAMLIDLKDAYNYGELDAEYFADSARQAEVQMQFMSKTIDDFSNFFKPSKEKVLFNVGESISDVIFLVSQQLKNNNILINIKLNGQSLFVYGYPNEFKQVLVNIINNSKDAILECRNKLDNDFVGNIDIEIYSQNSTVTISIADNGGGFVRDALDRMFEPYFSTKEESKGTGIGLYMSKVIIEDNMNGKLSIRNIDNGAFVIIELEGVTSNG